jgi:hypothetical protein
MEGEKPILESEFPELVDMVMKILIYQNSNRSAGQFAGDIKWWFNRYFFEPYGCSGKMNPIPPNPFKLVRKDRGRPQRANSAILEPYGRVRGQIWLN